MTLFIKAVIAAFAGISVEKLMTFEISPASLSVVSYWNDGAQILCVNRTKEILRSEFRIQEPGARI